MILRAIVTLFLLKASEWHDVLALNPKRRQQRLGLRSTSRSMQSGPDPPPLLQMQNELPRGSPSAVPSSALENSTLPPEIAMPLLPPPTAAILSKGSQKIPNKKTILTASKGAATPPAKQKITLPPKKGGPKSLKGGGKSTAPPCLQPGALPSTQPSLLPCNTFPPSVAPSHSTLRPTSKPSLTKVTTVPTSSPTVSLPPTPRIVAPTAIPTEYPTLQVFTFMPTEAPTSQKTMIGTESPSAGRFPTTPTERPSEAKLSATPSESPSAGVAPGSPTSTPTRSESIAFSSFQLQYNTTATNNPTAGDVSSANAVSMQYLHDFLTTALNFEGANLLQLKWVQSGISYSPIRVGYMGSIVLSANSIFTPTRAFLDSVIASAFQQPNVETLILILDNLPTSSPFSTTTSVTYTPNVVPQTAYQAPPSSSFASLGQRDSTKLLVGASVFLLVSAVMCQLARGRRRHASQFCKPRENMPGSGNQNVMKMTTQYLVEDDDDCTTTSASWSIVDARSVYRERVQVHHNPPDEDVEIEFHPRVRKEGLFDSPFTAVHTNLLRR